MSFVEMLNEGRLKSGDIDLFIEKWHNSKSKMSLREYLGFTEKEWQVFGSGSSEKAFEMALKRLNR
ncbi:hypothetical protein [Butyrivibrio proteoclasticus]|uniref:hypothetical protein n=1 Tax=Butyrivibrio proteoclasticus TaxID=43305 RepID=UPI00047A7746|nr:hypothetical protein [Butyrivibrio proteoclasticus]